MSNDFKCEELEPLLSAYHDGELSEAEHTAAERHLNGCDICQNRLLEIGAVANSLKSLPRLNPKNDVAANIEYLIVNQPKSASRFSRPLTWGAVGIAAAAAVFVVAVNMNGPSNMGSVPLTANSDTSSSSKVQSQTQAQKLEVAQSVDNSSNPQQGDMSSVAPGGTSQAVAAHREHTGELTGAAGSKKGAAGEPNDRPDQSEKKKSNLAPHVEVAQNNRVVAPIGGGTASGAHLDGSDPRLIAKSAGGAGTIGADSNLVAVYDTEQHGVTEELGITTDEDGLYAIKL